MKRQIRDAIDIVELIGSYLTLRKAGAAYKGLCPFHEEKTPSFTVSPVRQTFKCFGCGAGGDAFSFVQLKENVGFPEAMRMLAERAGISLEWQRGGERSGPAKQDLARANQWAMGVYRQLYEGPAGQAARAYVERRGISKAIADAFGLGFAPDAFDTLVGRAHAARMELDLLEAAGLLKRGERGNRYDTFRHRLMFPIIDPTGRVIGFGGRTLGDDPAKYLNTPATPLFDKSNSLFGLDHARHAVGPAGRAIVVEGYTDLMMAHQFGFMETVATLGTAMTDLHAALLRRYTDHVVLLFDSDEAGQRAADRALSVSLTSGLDVSLARVPEGKDPCDYLLVAGKSGMEGVLKAAMPALEFKWKLVAEACEASATGPGRRRAIEAYLQSLAGWLSRGVIDPIQKGLLVNQLSKILTLPAEELHRQLDAMAGRAARQSTRRSGGHDEARSGSATAAGRPAATGTGEAVGRSLVGAEQEALRQILEVLLNEPSYLPAVEGRFEPARFRDASLGAIAGELLEMLRSGEPYRIDELIGRFESPDFARMVTDLQARGERRGQYAAVIEGAIPCLRSCEQSREAVELSDGIRRPHGATASAQDAAAVAAANRSDEDRRLLALTERARNPHFSATKVRRRFL